MTSKLKTIEEIISELGEIPLCQCEAKCGQRVKINPNRYSYYKNHGYPRFLVGHGLNGKKRPEHSEKMKGEKNPMWNNPREDLQEKFKGEGNPMYGEKAWNTGLTKETDERVKSVSDKLSGVPKSEEHKAKLRIPHPWQCGDNNCMRDPEIKEKHQEVIKTQEFHDKMSLSIKKNWEDPEFRKCHSGENTSNWQGGISFGIYCPKFNSKKKEEIRNIFHRKCVICDRPEHDNIIASGKRKGYIMKLHVHHVDYNKMQGCSGHQWRLAPLCNSCHAKTTIGDRKEWELRLSEMIFVFDEIDSFIDMTKNIKEISDLFINKDLINEV